ncbi:single-stranded DNA-binding protein [Subtercola sp. RTI3]|uniref:single-stranded DNA-binding protein n=1 Tax=Subtercola sp. RTI3 TaxID=3048639 RepID=UPI002B22922F|nr:single-stranded DNA-binding protein [Subtercola sp. RTI3]MEA9983670.1 single-stranded DNA-binding protein [Subtercola sp. RTI3]
MAGETVVTVVGNLVGDPELRYTQSGLAVVNLTIASTPKVYDKQSGDMKDGAALFMRASAWREFAEHIAGSLTKGTRVVAVGALRQRSYETKEGEKRTSIELEIDSIGPDLRWATVQVTRAVSGAGARGAAPASGTTDEPWATSAPATSSTGPDVWNTPASYDDTTPF